MNTDGSLDTSFISGLSANDFVTFTSIQSDGKILIGGYFTSYNGISRNGISRLNADGSLDPSFNPGTGANAAVQTIKIQMDGKIIIGGAFTTLNGITRNRIARLKADGSLDNSFNGQMGVNGSVYCTPIQSDGKIIIGGEYTLFNETSRKYIARLNVDGTLDDSFNPGSGTDGPIYTTSIQQDGKIIIGGQFTVYNGISRNKIVRLNTDGSLDPDFNVGIGPNPFLYSTSIQSDGKIIIGGSFTTFNGAARNRIGRLNTNGSLDTSFNIGTGANSEVRFISIQPDGKILIGGAFSSYNGVSRICIARLNMDGSLDTSFNTGTGGNGTVFSMSIQSDGKIVIGGQFTTFNGTSRNRIARLNADGSLDTGFNPGTGSNDIVNSISIQSNGKIVIAGKFTTFNGTSRNRIACLNADGSLDTGFNPNTGANFTINSTSIQLDGKIIIGGGFTSYNGIGKNRIARINGDTPLSVDEQKIFQAKIVLYPNPAKNILNVSKISELNGKGFGVVDLFGKTVLYGTLADDNSIDVSRLSSGLYLLKVDGGGYASKFIKE